MLKPRSQFRGEEKHQHTASDVGEFSGEGELSVRLGLLVDLVQLRWLYRQFSPGIRRRLVALAVYVKCARHSAIFDAGGQLL